MNLVGGFKIAASAALAGISSAEAQWTFKKIADFNTPVPGAGVTFGAFGLLSVENGVVGFTGYTGAPTVTAGLYTGSGGPLTMIANHTTSVPGGTGTFTGFGLITGSVPSMSNGQTAFHGEIMNAFSPTGIYLRDGPLLLKVVDYLTPVPNGSGGGFFAMGQPSQHNGRVVFAGRESGDAQRGIYSWEGGPLSIVADRSTPIPGGSGTFTDLGGTSLDSDGSVLFTGAGSGGYRGLFIVDPAGTITRRYDTNTVVPGGNGGTFEGLGGVLNQGRVAFYGFGADQEGFFTDVGGPLVAVVQDGTPAPSVPGAVFQGYGRIALDHGVVAFQANLSNGNIGVYSTHTGSVQKVANLGDIIDGRLVQMAFMGTESLDGNSIAIKLVFSGNPVTEGIYLATIDLPCYPDCTADGALTVADFGCFQSRFVLQLPWADCNHDAALTVADFGCFQTKFVAGCP